MLKPRLITFFIALYIALNFVIGGAQVNAHAHLISSTPFNGASLNQLPKEIELTFNEGVKINLNNTTLLDPKGERISSEIRATENKVVLKPRYREEIKGSYLIQYSLLSKDGHLVSDYITFNYLKASVTTKKSSLIKNIAKIAEVVSWVLIFLLASIKRSKKAELALLLLIGSFLTIIVNLCYLYSELGSTLITSNPGRYTLALWLASLTAYYAEKNLFYILSALLFSSLALFSGHSLSLHKFEAVSKISVALHLLGAYLWATQILRLKFRPSEKQLESTRLVSTYALFLTLTAGLLPLILIVAQSKPTLSSAWVLFLSLKLFFIFLILILGYKHHQLSKSIKAETLATIKRTLNYEAALFIIVLGLAGGLTANGLPSAKSVKIAEVSTENISFQSYLLFDNGIKGDATLIAKKKDWDVMLNFKDKLKNIDNFITLKIINQDLKIESGEIKMLGGPTHYMASIDLPYKGKYLLTFSYFEDEFREVKGELSYEFK